MPKNSLKTHESLLQSQLPRPSYSLLRPTFIMDENTEQSNATT